MKLRLERYALGQKATLGKLFSGDEQLCYTLEDVVREIEGDPVESWKIDGQTAIPRGTYKIGIDFSPHFKRDLPHLLNVPGYVGVRIHPGNTDADTEGCILLGGKPTNDDFIPNSRMTFDRVFALMQDAEDNGEMTTLEIT